MYPQLGGFGEVWRGLARFEPLYTVVYGTRRVLVHGEILYFEEVPTARYGRLYTCTRQVHRVSYYKSTPYIEALYYIIIIHTQYILVYLCTWLVLGGVFWDAGCFVAFRGVFCGL